MVQTRSTNPEIIRPDFSARVTPPRLNPANPISTDSSTSSSEVYLSANMSQNPFGSPSVPNPSPYANIYPPLPNFPDPSKMTYPTPETTTSTEHPPAPNNFPSSSSTASKGRGQDEDQQSQAAHASSLGALNDVVREEIKQNGGLNLDSDLVKLLLIRQLTAEGPPQIHNPQSSSNVANHLKWQQLGKDVQPALLLDGSNFPAWLAALKDTVGSVTPHTNYFSEDRSASDSPTSNGVLAIIKSSVDPALRSSLNGMTAHGAYTSLKNRFAKPSWSLLLNRWSDVAQAPDTSDSISAGYESIKRSLLDLEERLGGWSTDKLLSLSFHSSLKRYHQPLADAMDSRIAISPNLQITSTDLLNTVLGLHQTSGSVTSSLMGMSSQRGGRGGRGGQGGRSGSSNRGSRGSRGGRSGQSLGDQHPPDAWGRKNISPSYPCTSCWEWGHWVPDCPRTKNNLPALVDPRESDPNWRPKKSSVLSSRLVVTDSSLASVSATPDQPEDILVDTGATNHVTSHSKFFTHLRPTNMRLRVASQECISVEGVGTAVIPTCFGDLRLSNVLLCSRVNGSVLSVGFFDRWDGTTSFLNGAFIFSQDSKSFPSYCSNYRWFIPASPLSSFVPDVSSKHSSVSNHSLSSISSQLWHSRLGHLAIRSLNRTIAERCVHGLPETKFKAVTGKCHSCSLAKSTHNPVISVSRELASKPGAIVAIDLVGPFPPALDGSKYGLVIHDIFSRMTSVIGLKAKGDAAKEVMDWIDKFNKHSDHDVLCIRSDNGGEFISNKFNLFLQKLHIRHEMSVPYKHHQNGNVERTNRTLLDMARTFLIHAKLPNSLWLLALRQAAFIFNRILHVDDFKTPYELSLGKTPSLDMVRIFGCRAYMHDLNYPKQFVTRSTPLIHVGISEVSHGWILWDPVTNKLERSASVRFHEDDLPSPVPGVKSLEAVLSSIQVSMLGDFTQIKEFEVQDACLSSAVSLSPFLSDAPNTYHQAVRSELKVEWMAACDAEIEMMVNLRVWEEVPFSDDLEILNCRWVFALKRDQEGEIVKFKARIVAQGFRQVHGVNVGETFAPTPTFSSLRILLAMASRFKWPVASFDVKSAFLHSDINHDVYIRPPPGVGVSPGCVLKLRKALYGTKQASRCWWLHLKSKLASIGFHPNLEDQSTYIYRSGANMAFLWVHVDDGLFTASSQTLMDSLKSKLDSVLDLKWDTRLSSIVGLRVREVDGGFTLDQPMLIDKIINMNPSNIKTRSPLPSTDLVSKPSREMDLEYMSRIGCLLYLSMGSRPDITFSVNFLVRFSMAPDSTHWAALEHLISYLRYSAHLALPIVASKSGSEAITTFVDANWGGEGARSVHGYFSKLWGAPVSWSSKRQTCIARSTCQAEYMALSFASKDACFISSILSGFFSLPPPLLLSDNRAAVHISKDCGTRKEHRHFMVQTRSTNPEIIRPDFSARVTPPRLNPANPISTDSSTSSSEVYLSANMSQNPFGSPSVPNPSPYANIYPPLPNFPDPSKMTYPTPETTTSTEHPPAPNNFPSSSSTASKGRGQDEDQQSQAAHASSLGALNDVVREEIKQNGGLNLDSDLVKLLLIRQLTAEGPPQIHNPQSSSNVANHLKWQQLGKDVQPALLLDGSNFPAWLAALKDTVGSVTPHTNYFSEDRSASDSPTSNGVLAIIKSSVDPALRSSLNGMTAHGAYTSLKNRFAKPSWSLLLNRWSDVAQAPDTSDSISAGYESIKRSLLDLEERLGGWSTDKLLSLSFHSSLKRYHQPLADAMDSRIAISPNLQITSTDLLNTVSGLHQTSGSVTSSLMGMSSQRGGRGGRGGQGGRSGSSNRGSRGSRGGRSGQSLGDQHPPDAWGRKNISPSYPCTSCWEWGHWVPDCPRTKNNLPALVDPRESDPNWRPKKSSVLSSRLVVTDSSLASVSATPDQPEDILVDTGATNHVTSHSKFFTHLRPTNMRLRVASQECISVEGVGTAVIPTCFGDLRLSNVLLCSRVNGSVLSVGFFDRWDGTTSFLNGAFIFSQDSKSFPSYCSNYQWFIPASPLSSFVPDVSSKHSSVSNHSLSSISSQLWHSRLGHLAIRSLNRTIAERCVHGLPETKFKAVTGKCHSCSLAKSTHNPVISVSRELASKPGAIVAIDLVGPFPPALDGSKYGLVIHDIFSRMTSVIGLKAKGDAAKEVMDWIDKFNKHSDHDVLCIRSDNGGEFISNKFNLFLQKLHIRHEMSVPYKHHQNGNVERTNRTLLDMARTFLIHAKLPNSLWLLALRQAAFIFNRILHVDDFKTPYELSLGKTPSLDMVRIFGCRAYMHDLNYPKQFVTRSTPLIHVGISEVSHGWILWDPVTNKLERSASVRFHEDDLPSPVPGVKSLEAVLSSIQVSMLGDFTQIKEFEVQDACLSSAVSLSPFLSDAPNTYHQAVRSELKVEWMAACDAEIEMMVNLRVWEEVPFSDDLEILNCRWVFALKRDQEGEIVKFKARIVAQGFRQVHGVNVGETFAPTPTFSSLRILLAMASRFKWPVASFDVKSAFLHSDINHDVYIRPPPGVGVSPGCVLKLRKALYGTKQASQCWWLHLKSKLASIGFHPNLEDQSTYIYRSGANMAFLWVHVDDGLFTASSQTLMDSLKSKLDSVLDLKWDTRLSSIVGLRVREVDGGFTLDQPMLIDKIINMNPSNIKTRSPLPSTDLVSKPSREMDLEYMSRIGCLLYLSMGSRPDITFSVNFLVRFSMAPDSTHWAALEHLISYLRYSAHLALPIVASKSGSEAITTFVDANWGGEGARSVHGYFSKLWGAPVSWSSKRQTCIARSTCQAEYMALSFASKDACFISSILSGFFSLPPPLLLSDNRAAVHISKDCGTRKEHRHVD
ncbi:hypothetical protein MJO28_015826 [Puccinia striiformis f. sp. tritici]|uniref:Uncharacterized protein n=1 Tax=Puccinia striiformis f. sp. tritici TaxID=168172 RepID=A0ACC0DQW1_9BASI|nr:hypothetical protein MJO28_015826 [Puccinia striiformis f. sp. tritici]